MKLIITSFSNIFGLTKQHILQNNSTFLVKHNGVQNQCAVPKWLHQLMNSIQPFQPLPSVPILYLSFTSQVNIHPNKRSPHYKTIQKTEGAFHPSVIAVMGYNRTWPIALRYGTHKYGGLHMKSLDVETLINKYNASDH